MKGWLHGCLVRHRRKLFVVPLLLCTVELLAFFAVREWELKTIDEILACYDVYFYWLEVFTASIVVLNAATIMFLFGIVMKFGWLVSCENPEMYDKIIDKLFR